MADLHSPTRASRAARALLLAFGAALVMALPAQTATAQPSLPPLEDCATDPLSCELPEVDTCVENPASCLPDTPLPEVDECVAHPASCNLTDPVPSVDRCLEQPDDCVPQPPKVDRCVEDRTRCVTEPDREDPEDSRAEEDDTGSAVPGGRDDTPHGPRAATTGGSGDVEAADAGDVAPSSSSETPLTTVAAAPASSDIVSSIGQGVVDAARRFAFPLALAGFVAIFLLVQRRIDGRDPKLTAAPIDSRDDVVPFR